MICKQRQKKTMMTGTTKRQHKQHKTEDNNGKLKPTVIVIASKDTMNFKSRTCKQTIVTN